MMNRLLKVMVLGGLVLAAGVAAVTLYSQKPSAPEIESIFGFERTSKDERLNPLSKKKGCFTPRFR